MSGGGGDEAPPGVEALDEEAEVGTEEAALLYFGRYSESRRALPWEQWSFRERANYCLDRLFLGFLAVFVIVLLSEVCYKTWYVTDVRKIAAYLTGSGGWLFRWLFAQEEKEELFEL